MSTDSFRAYADLIEKAVKHQFRDTTKMIPEEVAVSKMETTTPTCSKSSQVGNEAAKREATCNEKVTGCNQSGNAAKLRDALERCANMGEQIDNQLGNSEETVYAFRNERCIAHNISECARSALSASPRNCDIMDWRTAWAKWRTECHPQKPCGYAEVVSGTEQFMDWYMSEAKGETK